MLVLSRKAGQAIQIGEGITLTVTQIKGNQVRLGIEAPAEVPIHRRELVIKNSDDSSFVMVDHDPGNASGICPAV